MDFAYMLNTYSASVAATPFSKNVVTLNSRQIAVLQLTFGSFVRFCLFFASDTCGAPWLKWDVCQLMFSISRTWNAHSVWNRVGFAIDGLDAFIT